MRTLNIEVSDSKDEISIKGHTISKWVDGNGYYNCDDCGITLDVKFDVFDVLDDTMSTFCKECLNKDSN